MPFRFFERAIVKLFVSANLVKIPDIVVLPVLYVFKKKIFFFLVITGSNGISIPRIKIRDKGHRSQQQFIA